MGLLHAVPTLQVIMGLNSSWLPCMLSLQHCHFVFRCADNNCHWPDLGNGSAGMRCNQNSVQDKHTCLKQRVCSRSDEYYRCEHEDSVSFLKVVSARRVLSLEGNNRRPWLTAISLLSNSQSARQILYDAAGAPKPDWFGVLFRPQCQFCIV